MRKYVILQERKEKVMKVEVTCRKCRKKFDFDTDTKMKLLLENIQIKQTDKYLVMCPHCNAKNTVEIEH